MAKPESKPKSNKSKVLLVILVLVVIFGGCVAAVGLYAKATITEGTVEPERIVERSLTEAPDKSGFNAYLADALIAKTYDSSKVKTNFSSNVSINSDSVTLEGPDANADVVKYIVSSLSGRIGESYPSYEGDFGDKFDMYPTVALPEDKISSFEFKQGEVNPDDENTKNESDYFYFTVETGEFDIVSDPAVSQHTFPVYASADLSPAINKVTDSLVEMFDVESCEVKAISSKVDGKTNRLLDQLQYLTLSATYNVKLGLDFKFPYDNLGKAVLSFDVTVEQKYDYTWVNVSIGEDRMTLKLNEEEQLTMDAVISDKAASGDYELTFKSSDESVLSVDKDGFVKGLKISEKPVTVTATLKYLGNTYTDTCEIFVVVPVEKVVAEPSEITLSVGDAKTLGCVITPEDATIKTVRWYTEDNSIANVSEDGVVTAKSEGTVKVYAVTDDGYFRSSCVVNVTGGEADGN